MRTFMQWTPGRTRCTALLLASLAALAGPVGGLSAQEKIQTLPQSVDGPAATAPAPMLTLDDCLVLAFEKQPALAAALREPGRRAGQPAGAEQPPVLRPAARPRPAGPQAAGVPRHHDRQRRASAGRVGDALLGDAQLLHDHLRPHAAEPAQRPDRPPGARPEDGEARPRRRRGDEGHQDRPRQLRHQHRRAQDQEDRGGRRRAEGLRRPARSDRRRPGIPA